MRSRRITLPLSDPVCRGIEWIKKQYDVSGSRVIMDAVAIFLFILQKHREGYHICMVKDDPGAPNRLRLYDVALPSWRYFSDGLLWSLQEQGTPTAGTGKQPDVVQQRSFDVGETETPAEATEGEPLASGAKLTKKGG